MSTKIQIIILLIGSLVIFSSCRKDDRIPDFPWTEKDTVKPRYAWIDAGGNFQRFANSKSNIAEDLKKIKESGFTDIIVDVRPTTGDVLFASSAASPVKRIDVWEGSTYKWCNRTATWDYLQEFIDEGHSLGLKVNASVNTFVGGYLCPYGLGSEGMLFIEPSRKSWATVINSASGLTSTMDLTNDAKDYGAKFLNPSNSEVQDYVLRILTDLAGYNLDGIVLDRCRYDDYGLMSDFSPASRAGFEQFAGRTVEHYPNDIMAAGTTSIPASETGLFKLWLEFRAKTIYDFVARARTAVKGVNKNIRFGVYVGGWYSTYYESGVNWASKKYETSAYYPEWASSDYNEYGLADLTDFMFIGAYAGTDSIFGSGEWTMQGFSEQAEKLLEKDTEFSCGPDIGNSPGWENGGQAALIPDAIDACITPSDGFFVFDLCHIRSFDYWDAFKKGFAKYDL